MNKLIHLLFFLALTTNAQTPMSQLEVSSFKMKVQHQAQQTKTMTLDFVQSKHLDFLSNDIESSGNLFFKQPNLVKWEYTKPYLHSSLFKDNKLYVNDEGKISDVDLSSNKMFKQLNTLVANSITGNLFEEDTFEISYYKSKDGFEVLFIPRNTKLKKYVSQLRMFFNEDAYVTKVKMTEPTEDYTLIIFSNRQINTTIADTVFAH